MIKLFDTTIEPIPPVVFSQSSDPHSVSVAFEIYSSPRFSKLCTSLILLCPVFWFPSSLASSTSFFCPVLRASSQLYLWSLALSVCFLSLFCSFTFSSLLRFLSLFFMRSYMYLLSRHLLRTYCMFCTVLGFWHRRMNETDTAPDFMELTMNFPIN